MHTCLCRQVEGHHQERNSIRLCEIFDEQRRTETKSEGVEFLDYFVLSLDEQMRKCSRKTIRAVFLFVHRSLRVRFLPSFLPSQHIYSFDIFTADRI